MTKSEAQHAYRAAWQQFLLTEDPKQRMQLAELLGGLQRRCCTCGKFCEEWRVFANTLPSYWAYRERLVEECYQTAEYVINRLAK